MLATDKMLDGSNIQEKPLKSYSSLKKYSLLILLSALILGGCGYHNANVYNGEDRQVYLSEWKNRTSKLSLSSGMYRSLVQWFQKSSSITTVRQKQDADLILAGEIISIDLPSLSYTDRTTSEVKVKLRVRYVMYDVLTNEILLEVPNEQWSEEYTPISSNSSSPEKENEALATIVDDLSKKIYQQTLRALRKKNV